MNTVDLGTPPPTPGFLLDALPRRVGLTLPELQLVAERAGGAPLPFEPAAPAAVSTLEARLGPGPAGSDDAAYQAALAALHDPVETLTRRGLLTGDRVESALLGAIGLLATPRVALDLEVAVDGMRARAWHRESAGAVATLATVDGIVFELAWLPADRWGGELGRVPVLPEDFDPGPSAVPAVLDVPFGLLDAAGEALDSGRADLLPRLLADHADGGSPTDLEASLVALNSEARGRLRAMVTDLGGGPATVVGIVSWVLVADGWRALRPHGGDGRDRIEIRAVEPAALAIELAPVLAEVSR